MQIVWSLCCNAKVLVLLRVAVAKHVPKFLQAHSHLLHKGPKPDEPRIVKEQDDSDIEDYDGVRSLHT